MTAAVNPDEWVSSEHVYVWPKPQRRGDRFIVKWKVAGRPTSRSKPASAGRKPEATAEAYRAELVRAQLNPAGRWHRVSLLPEHMHLAERVDDSPALEDDVLTVAVAMLAAGWSAWSPGNRKSRVETTACLVAALLDAELPSGITSADARRALRDLLLPPVDGCVDPDTLPQAVRDAAAWLPAHTRSATDLTLPVVEEALTAASRQLTGTLYGGDRISATRGSLSLLCAEAVRRGLLQTNPVRDARRVSEMVPTIADPNGDADDDVDGTVVDPERVLGADECRAFCMAVREVSHVSWKFAVLFTLLWTTGMRPSEALGIRNTHKRLHLPEEGWGWVRLWRPTVDAGAARWTGTGSKHADKTHLKARRKGVERLVPLPPETVAALRELKERNGTRPGARLFVNQAGNPFTLDHLGRVFRSVRRRLYPDGPLSGATMYQLRHSFITVGIQMGVPVVKLAELVGNSAPTINRVYARLLTTEDERFRELMAGVFGQ